jgi:selenocysteine lyase/cysteine desulfurase
VVDYRPGAGIRIAPHFYNEAGEIDAAADAIADILRSGEWKRHPERVTGQVN